VRYFLAKTIRTAKLVDGVSQELGIGRRPTITDVAEAAGVSVATVDRVLNARQPVREATASRVYEAASKVGYHTTELVRRRLNQNIPFHRLGFVLQRPEQHFYQSLAAEIMSAAQSAVAFRAEAHIEYAQSQTPAEVVASLRAAAARSAAVAMVSIDHPTITAAVAELRDAGIPVFSLLSDFAQGMRAGYIGLDNRKAGRTAAWFIARTARTRGKVAVFVGSHRFLGHELREIGLRTYFRENAPEFEVLDTLVNLETPAIAHEAMLDLLKRHKTLAGVYVAGGGMEGVIAALREEGDGRDLVAVCNELTPLSREALSDHVVAAVIGTPAGSLAEKLVALMARAAEHNEEGRPDAVYLPFDIYISENI
jgi:LacI family transcriptional regulator